MESMHDKDEVKKEAPCEVIPDFMTVRKTSLKRLLTEVKLQKSSRSMPGNFSVLGANIYRYLPLGGDTPG